MASFISSTGKHLIVLAVSGLENVMTMIKNDEAGNVVINVCTTSFGSHTLLWNLSSFINPDLLDPQ